MANPNADTVDGVDSSTLARTGGRTGTVDVTGMLTDTDTTDIYYADTTVAYPPSAPLARR